MRAEKAELEALVVRLIELPELLNSTRSSTKRLAKQVFEEVILPKFDELCGDDKMSIGLPDCAEPYNCLPTYKGHINRGEYDEATDFARNWLKSLRS